MIDGAIRAIHIEFEAYSLNISEAKSNIVRKIEIPMLNKKNDAANINIRTCNNINNRLAIYRIV